MRISDWSSDVCSSDLLDEALAAADRAWPLWRAKTPDERAALMHKAAGLIRERIEPIATLLTLEQGKPNAAARGEVASAAGLLAYFAAEGQIGRAHVCTTVNNAQLVCLLLLEKKKNMI